jgi:hypothetical protein
MAIFYGILWNVLCLISDSTETIRFLALDFYEVIVDIYHLIELSPHRKPLSNYQSSRRNLELVIYLLIKKKLNF